MTPSASRAVLLVLGSLAAACSDACVSAELAPESPTPPPRATRPKAREDLAARLTLRGQVRGEDGGPVEGALIRCETEGTRAAARTSAGDAVSDRDGSFAVADLGPGPYSVRVSAAGYQDAEERWSPLAGTLQLRMAPRGVVRGIVRGPDGAAVELALVRAQSSGRLDRWALTGADGSYRLESVAPGVAWTLIVEARELGRRTEREPVVVGADSGEAVRDVAIPLRGYVAVEARDPEGSSVRVGRLLVGGVPSDDIDPRCDGVAVLRSEPGPVTIGLDVDGFLPRTVDVEVPEGRVAEVRVDLDRGQAIQGVVVDERDRPVDGATIELRRPERDLEALPRIRVAASDGTFRFEGLEPRAHSLVARADRHVATSGASATPGEPVRLVLTRQARVAFRPVLPEGAGTRSGVEMREGRGPSKWFPWRTELQAWVDPGPRRLTFEVDGFVPIETSISLAPGEEGSLGTLRFDAGCFVRGVVRNAAAEPVRGVVSAVVRTTSERLTGTRFHADAEGRFRERLPAGDCEFSFDFGGGRVTKRVTLVEGEETTVEISEPR